MSRILSRPLRIFTAVWDKSYLDLFEKTMVRSLCWPDNNKALLDEKPVWSIHTLSKDKEQALEIAKKTGVEEFEITLFEKRPNAPDTDMGYIILQNFIREIEVCLETDSRLLLCPPDTLMGDGSLRSIFLAGIQDGTCVAVAHPRVLPTILEPPEELCTVINKPLSNAELVSAAWRHLHRSWVDAEAGLPKNNTYVGGVSWREIKRGLYSVQHRLPTNYLLDFNKSDLKFYKEQISFGVLDHVWPSNLIGEQRERYIASSDQAFLVEITERENNVPPTYPTNKREPDRFWRSAPHNQIFRQFPSTFREVNV